MCDEFLQSWPEDEHVWINDSSEYDRMTNEGRKEKFAKYINDYRKSSSWEPIHEAAWTGKMKKLKCLLLHEEADINRRTMYGLTPLYLACQKRDWKMVKFLLRNGADPNARDFDSLDCLPLEAAILQETELCLSLLLRYGADANSTLDMTFDCATIAHLVAETGNVCMMKMLTESGIEWDVEDPWGWNPFLLACEKGKTAAMKYLFNIETESCRQDLVNIAERKKGLTPLCMTALAGNVEGLEFLIRNGADVNHVTKDGLTALHLAVVGESEKSFDLLFHESDLDQLQKWPGVKCLVDTCVTTKQHKALKRVLESGFPVDELISHRRFPESRNRLTPLCIAITKEDLDAVKLLLCYGANCNAMSEYSAAPLTLGVRCQNMEIVEILIERGSDVNFADGEAIRKAIKLRNASVLEALLKAGANCEFANWKQISNRENPNYFASVFLNMLRKYRDFNEWTTAYNYLKDVLPAEPISNMDYEIIKKRNCKRSSPDENTNSLTPSYQETEVDYFAVSTEGCNFKILGGRKRRRI